MLYVADTHSLIWFLTDDKRLGKQAREIYEKADLGKVLIIIPSIVLAELVFICEKKDAVIEFKNILNKLNESSNYLHYNLDMKIILEIAEMANLRDMHDRMIIATAKINKAVLITKDKKINDSKLVGTVWD